MRIDLGFRLSSYLTLAVACLCLGYAEQLFLPSIAIFVLPVLVLLTVAYFAEGQWVLPIWAANLLGLAIAAGSGLWIAVCLIRPGGFRMDGIPLPVALLPYLGPLLTILLVAKLFRPKKNLDLWLLQGMGLLQVALGCVLANDFFFGVLLLVYLACAVWFLTMFHLQRELADRTPAPTPVPLPQPAGGGLPGVRWVSCPVGRWTAGVTLAGLVLFLLVPRFGATQWNLLTQLSSGWSDTWPAHTGFSEMIDLNRTGKLQVNEEEALTVTVHDDRGHPKLDLSLQQRWRGVVLDRYHDGRWVSSSLFHRFPDRGPTPGMGPRPRPDLPTLAEELPRLGDRQYFLEFSVSPHDVGGLVLADPVVVFPGERALPVAARTDDETPEIYFVPSDWTLILPGRYRGREDLLHYRQVTVPLEEYDLSFPVRVSNAYQSQLCWHRGYTLREWTDQQLRDLASRSAYRLDPEDLQYVEASQGRSLIPESHEKVARALCSYLSTSGEYTYTLELKRHDRRLDPTEDFLRNVKQGHCERFAAALAAMLRSQGIPSRIIKGFHGCESLGEGRYLIRHSHAHSWVEALIPRTQPDGNVEMHWLTLDPTSAIEAPSLSRFSASWWWDHGNRLGRLAWKDFVVEYDVEQQSTLWEEGGHLVSMATLRKLGRMVVRLGPWLMLVFVVVGCWCIGRRLRFRRGAAVSVQGPRVYIYVRLLAILARRCRLRPAPAQTPQELGEEARSLLLSLPGISQLANVPARVVEQFYRVRYGAQPLSASEEQEMRRQLEHLDTELAHARSR